MGSAIGFRLQTYVVLFRADGNGAPPAPDYWVTLSSSSSLRSPGTIVIGTASFEA